jgi:hypothetical protein
MAIQTVVAAERLVIALFLIPRTASDARGLPGVCQGSARGLPGFARKRTLRLVTSRYRSLSFWSTLRCFSSLRMTNNPPPPKQKPPRQTPRATRYDLTVSPAAVGMITLKPFPFVLAACGLFSCVILLGLAFDRSPTKWKSPKITSLSSSSSTTSKFSLNYKSAATNRQSNDTTSELGRSSNATLGVCNIHLPLPPVPSALHQPSFANPQLSSSRRFLS